MPPSKFTYSKPPNAPSSALREDAVESGLIGTHHGLNYGFLQNEEDESNGRRHPIPSFAP